MGFSSSDNFQKNWQCLQKEIGRVSKKEQDLKNTTNNQINIKYLYWILLLLFISLLMIIPILSITIFCVLFSLSIVSLFVLLIIDNELASNIIKKFIGLFFPVLILISIAGHTGLLFKVVNVFTDNLFEFFNGIIIVADLLILICVFVASINYWNKARNSVVIGEFIGPGGKPDEESRAIRQLLASELARLRELYKTSQNQRIRVRHLLANYPETSGPRFQTSTATDQMKGDLTVGGLGTVPLNFLNIIYRRLSSRQITGAVSIVDGYHMITAEVSDKRAHWQKITEDFHDRLIWKINPYSSNLKSNNYFSPKSVEEQVEELACIIFYRIYGISASNRTKAIIDYNNGIRAYKSALHEPLRRRQLVHAAKEHFQQAISEDDCFYAAYYNLGIQFLELGRIDLAIKIFNKSIEKYPDASKNQQAYYALADCMFALLREKWAPLMRKFWKNDKKQPFFNFTTGRKGDIDNVKINKCQKECYEIKDICDSIINNYSENNDYYVKALMLRSSINMYLGNHQGFYDDCIKGLNSAVCRHFKCNNYSTKDIAVEALLNYAMASVWKAVYECVDSGIDFYTIKKKDPAYRFAMNAISMAECLDYNKSNVHYIRGRTNYYFREFQESINAYKRAISLEPDNYNYLANYAAAQISYYREYGYKIEKNENYYYFLNVMEQLFSCSSRIRHEVLEVIAEISLSSEMPLSDSEKIRMQLDQTMNRIRVIINNITKLIFTQSKINDNCSKVSEWRDKDPIKQIDHYLQRARILTEFAHVVDKSQIPKCQIQNEHGDIDELKKMNGFIKDIYAEVQKNRCFPKEICPALNKINAISDQIINEIKSVRNKYKHVCSDTIVKWSLGQLYAIEGRECFSKKEFYKAAICFFKAIQIFELSESTREKNKAIIPMEAKQQKLYSFYAYALSMACKDQMIYGKDEKMKNEIGRTILYNCQISFDEDQFDSFAYFSKGMYHFCNQNIGEAKKSFKNALSLLPEPSWRPVYLWYEDKIQEHSMELYTYYGITSIKEAGMPGAKKERLEALDEGIQSLSYVVDEMPLKEKVIKDLTDIDKYETDLLVKVLYWLGRAYFLQGDFEKAYEQFSLCKHYTNKEKDIYPLFDFNSAKCLQRLRNLPEAIRIYSQIIKKMPAMKSNQKEKNAIVQDDKLTEDNQYKTDEELRCHCLLYRACCLAGTSEIKAATEDLKKSKEYLNKKVKCTVSDEVFISIESKWAIEENAAQGIVHFHAGNIDLALKYLRNSLPHTNSSDLLYHLLITLTHYYWLQHKKDLNVCREDLALVMKIRDELCLEKSSIDTMTLKDSIIREITKGKQEDRR